MQLSILNTLHMSTCVSVPTQGITYNPSSGPTHQSITTLQATLSMGKPYVTTCNQVQCEAWSSTLIFCQ